MGIFGMGFGTAGKEYGLSLQDARKRKAQMKIDADASRPTIMHVDNNDAVSYVDIGGYSSTLYNVNQDITQQVALINEYRRMATHQEVDDAVDDIINGVISCDQEDDPVEINLSKVDLSDVMKDRIRDEFYNIMNMLDMQESAYERVRQWYIDGSLVVHNVVDEKNLTDGIQRIEILDPRAIRRVKETERVIDPNTRVEMERIRQDYYIYDRSVLAAERTAGYNKVNTAIKMSVDSVVTCHSGIRSSDNRLIYSHLEKARKPLNNLRLMEDAVVVYRITRAPERRVFYIDVGSLPKKSAEEYVQGVMNKFKTTIMYDAESGSVKYNNNQVSMIEDYWLPRREGTKGTEIDTLAGGQNLGEIDDVIYFQKKLLRALNVPPSRLEGDSTINIGGTRLAEITRDELKFAKFIQRLRRRLVSLFTDILKIQLVLKRIMTDEEFIEIQNDIRYEFASDSFVKEQQEGEALAQRLNALEQIQPHVGKYFSMDYVRRNILHMSDDDIERENKIIAKEISDNLYPDPKKADQEDGDMF